MSFNAVMMLMFSMALGCAQQVRVHLPPEVPGPSDSTATTQRGRLQFAVHGNLNPWLLSIRRDGNRTGRNVEFTVFEVVPGGTRVRMLHRRRLLNPFSYAGSKRSFDGRFLLTLDDLTIQDEDPKHSFAIYDFVCGEHTERRLTDFMPREMVDSMRESQIGLNERDWYREAWMDDRYKKMYFFSPTQPEEIPGSKNWGGDRPYVVVDLRSRTAKLAPPGQDLPDHAYRNPSCGIAWQWSMGEADLPSMDAEFAYPKYLRCRYFNGGPQWHDDAPEELRLVADFLDPGEQIVYRLDPATGGYLRHPADESTREFEWLP